MSAHGSVAVIPVNVEALVEEIESQVERMPVRNTQALRALRRGYSRRIQAIHAEDVVAIAELLIAHRQVPRFIADELISSRPDAMEILSRTQIERLGSAMSGWDEVDSFACYLSGPAWREGLIDDEVVSEWTLSKNRWWRRAALVSTVPLNVKARGGGGDAPRTLRVCALLVDDRDQMVVKALSWALRALAVRDKHSVRQFVEENTTRLPACVSREVQQKLLTGRKNPKAAAQRI